MVLNEWNGKEEILMNNEGVFRCLVGEVSILSQIWYLSTVH